MSISLCNVAGHIEKACGKLNNSSLDATQNQKIKTVLNETISKPITHGEEEIGFNQKTARMTFIGPEFEDNMVFERNKNRRGVTQVYTVKVLQYHNFEKLQSAYNFHDNGFQYVTLDDDLRKGLQKFSDSPFDEDCQSAVSDAATRYLSIWAKQNSMSFAAIVPLGSVYRNTDEREVEANRAINMVHVDFQQSDLSSLLQNRYPKNVWKPEIETVTRKLSSAQYRALKITQIINLWMPLNERPTKNTLCVMDKETFNPLKDSRPYKNVDPDGNPAFTSLTVDYDGKQKWVAPENMTRGRGVIFNSYVTPHCAANLDQNAGVEYDEHRRSVEWRFALISELPNS